MKAELNKAKAVAQANHLVKLAEQILDGIESDDASIDAVIELEGRAGTLADYLVLFASGPPKSLIA